jgi:hypothetical protein
MATPRALAGAVLHALAQWPQATGRQINEPGGQNRSRLQTSGHFGGLRAGQPDLPATK